jgi:hypothetical protein
MPLNKVHLACKRRYLDPKVKLIYIHHGILRAIRNLNAVSAQALLQEHIAAYGNIDIERLAPY